MILNNASPILQVFSIKSNNGQGRDQQVEVPSNSYIEFPAHGEPPFLISMPIIPELHEQTRINSNGMATYIVVDNTNPHLHGTEYR